MCFYQLINFDNESGLMVIKKEIKLESGWKEVLGFEFENEYMIKLKEFLQEELASGKTIYPHGDDIFSAFDSTPFDKVKVVIIGQDPYHGPGQAHGMCFSVKKGVRIPPSLINIYKELESDVGLSSPGHGHLGQWAEQGVLLINAVLTVERGNAGSHHGQGWEIFTDKVIEILNKKKEGLVFLLWGAPAQRKAAMVDSRKHLILKAPHPSPLSAHRGFFGCRHFSQTNQYLKGRRIEEIDWGRF